MILFFLLLLLLPRPSLALYTPCANSNQEGFICSYPEEVNVGTCVSGDCCYIGRAAPANHVGQGTLSSSGLTVTGSGTAFQNELTLGSILTAGGQDRFIDSISSDTTLTVSEAFSPVLSGATFVYQRPVLRVDDGSCNPRLIVEPNGEIRFFPLVGSIGPAISVVPGNKSLLIDADQVQINGRPGYADKHVTAGGSSTYYIPSLSLVTASGGGSIASVTEVDILAGVSYLPAPVGKSNLVLISILINNGTAATRDYTCTLRRGASCAAGTAIGLGVGRLHTGGGDVDSLTWITREAGPGGSAVTLRACCKSSNATNAQTADRVDAIVAEY